MQTKIKILIAVVTIFILTGITIVFYYNQKNIKLQKETQDEVANNSLDEIGIMEFAGINKSETKQVENIQTSVTTNVAIGKVISMSNGSVLIDSENEKLSISINENTFVYSMRGSETLRKNTYDIKSGASVMIEYDENAKSAISIRIN